MEILTIPCFLETVEASSNDILPVLCGNNLALRTRCWLADIEQTGHQVLAGLNVTPDPWYYLMISERKCTYLVRYFNS